MVLTLHKITFSFYEWPCVQQEVSTFYFPLSLYGRESNAFGSNFQNGDSDGFTHFEVSLESKNDIFSSWYACMHMVYVHY